MNNLFKIIEHSKYIILLNNIAHVSKIYVSISSNHIRRNLNKSITVVENYILFSDKLIYLHFSFEFELVMGFYVVRFVENRGYLPEVFSKAFNSKTASAKILILWLFLFFCEVSVVSKNSPIGNGYGIIRNFPCISGSDVARHRELEIAPKINK